MVSSGQNEKPTTTVFDGPIGLLPNKTRSDLAGHGMRTECVTRAHHTCSALRVTRELLFLNRNDQSPRLACTCSPTRRENSDFLFFVLLVTFKNYVSSSDRDRHSRII